MGWLLIGTYVTIMLLQEWLCIPIVYTMHAIIIVTTMIIVILNSLFNGCYTPVCFSILAVFHYFCLLRSTLNIVS